MLKEFKVNTGSRSLGLQWCIEHPVEHLRWNVLAKLFSQKKPYHMVDRFLNITPLVHQLSLVLIIFLYLASVKTFCFILGDI